MQKTHGKIYLLLSKSDLYFMELVIFNLIFIFFQCFLVDISNRYASYIKYLTVNI